MCVCVCVCVLAFERTCVRLIVYIFEWFDNRIAPKTKKRY